MAEQLPIDELGQVPAGALGALLEDEGWERHASNLPASSLWVLREGDTRVDQLLVPEDPTFDDYATRLGEAVRAVAARDDRSVSDVLSRLVSAGSDVIRFRANHETPDGSVPLADGISLFEGVHLALRASAKASEERRPHFGNKYAKQAGLFVERARLGQTERGSYIVKVMARVPTPDSAQAGDQVIAPGITSKDRGIVFTLMRSLDAAKRASDQYRSQADPGAFHEAVSEGLSADMCDAIITMTGSGTGNTVAVDAQWALLSPVTETVPAFVAFGTEDLLALEKASEALKETETVHKAQIRGWVESLTRGSDVPGPGVVTVISVAGPNRGSRVRARLAASDYSRAIAAHRQGDRLDLEGDLTHEGNRAWLHNARLL